MLNPKDLRKNFKQAEAEVVPSSSLIEVEVGVEVGVGPTISFGWVGGVSGWRFGE